MKKANILNHYYSEDLISFLIKNIKKDTKNIILHSSLLGLGIPYEGLDRFADNLIDRLVYKSGYRLIIPVFTFDNEKYWSPKTSGSNCGALSICLLKKYLKYRTVHPIHSVLDISAQMSSSFAGNISKTSFGIDTIWEDILYQPYTLNIGLGIGLDGGGTFLHAIEQKINVPYRKFITLDKIVEINGHKIKDFKYFARLNSNSNKVIHNWKKVKQEFIKKELYCETVSPFFLSISNPLEIYIYLKSKLEKNPNWFIS